MRPRHLARRRFPSYPCMALLICSLLAPPGVADGKDPTAISNKLLMQLRGQTQASERDTDQASLVEMVGQVKLKAVVLQHPRRGSALLTLPDGKTCLLRLDATNPRGRTTLRIGGETFFVRRFTSSSIEIMDQRGELHFTLR